VLRIYARCATRALQYSPSAAYPPTRESTRTLKSFVSETVRPLQIAIQHSISTVRCFLLYRFAIPMLPCSMRSIPRLDRSVAFVLHSTSPSAISQFPVSVPCSAKFSTRYESTLLVSYSCKLFVALKKVNLFFFNHFQTLLPKHPGGGTLFSSGQPSSHTPNVGKRVATRTWLAHPISIAPELGSQVYG
jgi:hypothetical protein